MTNNTTSFTPTKGVEWIFGNRPEDQKARESFINNFFELDKLPEELKKEEVTNVHQN